MAATKIDLQDNLLIKIHTIFDVHESHSSNFKSVNKSDFHLTISSENAISLPPENLRNPKVFWHFSGSVEMKNCL